MRNRKAPVYNFSLLQAEGDRLPFYCTPTLKLRGKIATAAYTYAKRDGFRVSVTQIDPKSEDFYGREGFVVQRVANDYVPQRVPPSGRLVQQESCGDRARKTARLWSRIADAMDASGDETNGFIDRLISIDPQLDKYRSLMLSMSNGMCVLYPYHEEVVSRMEEAALIAEEQFA